jgi:hypothetical protein
MAWAWLGSLIKPLSNIFNPLTERIGQRIARRKPHLYVHPTRTQSIWCIATQGLPGSTVNEMMQVVFWADMNHDDDKLGLIITDAYPVGTRSQIGMVGRIILPPHNISHQQIAAFVNPIKGKRGQPYETRFILVDQFRRKYKTQKITFRWTGPPPPTSTP